MNIDILKHRRDLTAKQAEQVGNLITNMQRRLATLQSHHQQIVGRHAELGDLLVEHEKAEKEKKAKEPGPK